MRKSQANRKTDVKVYLNGKTLRSEKNLLLNYSGDVEGLKQQLALALRRSPQDPDYVVLSVRFQLPPDAKFHPLNEESFDASRFLTPHTHPKLQINVAEKPRQQKPQAGFRDKEKTLHRSTPIAESEHSLSPIPSPPATPPPENQPEVLRVKEDHNDADAVISRKIAMTNQTDFMSPANDGTPAASARKFATPKSTSVHDRYIPRSRSAKKTDPRRRSRSAGRPASSCAAEKNQTRARSAQRNTSRKKNERTLFSPPASNQKAEGLTTPMKKARSRGVMEAIKTGRYNEKPTPSGRRSIITWESSLRQNGQTLERRLFSPPRDKRLKKPAGNKGHKRRVRGEIVASSGRFSLDKGTRRRPQAKKDQSASLKRLQTELQVLMEVTGKTKEELQWLVESRGGNALSVSEKRLEEAETNYHRLLYEEAELSHHLKCVTNFRVEKILKQIKKKVDDPVELESCKESLRKVIEDEKKNKPICKVLIKTLESILDTKPESLEAKITDSLEMLDAAGKDFKSHADSVRKDVEKVLSEIEQWQQRRDAAPEYAKTIAAEEVKWLSREENANLEALQTMRTLIPLNIETLTIREFQQQVHAEGGFLPNELAAYLKDTKILHWTIQHQDQISRSNFLAGMNAHLWTNLDRYDLTELRAIAAVMPNKFEFDKDGRKNAWRQDFFRKLKGLVSQERGETVKGGWDPKTKRRREIKLPELTEEQKRKDIYFFQTPEQVFDHLKKLKDREERLTAKKVRLKEIDERLLKQAKGEYSDVLCDLRDPEIKKLFSKEALERIKADSKAKVDTLARELKILNKDIRSSERDLSQMPFSREALSAEFESLCMFMIDQLDNPMDFFGSSSSMQIVVPGVFDENPDILPPQTVRAKYITPEEEAILRKQEIEKAVSQRAMKASREAAINPNDEMDEKVPTNELLPNKVEGCPAEPDFMNKLNAQMMRMVLAKSADTPVKEPNVKTVENHPTIKPRSKLLQDLHTQSSQHLLHDQENNVPRPALGFLAELRCKSRTNQNTEITSGSSQDDISSMNGKKSMPGFLRELKQKAQNDHGNGDKNDATPHRHRPALGFLGELKQKAQNTKLQGDDQCKENMPPINHGSALDFLAQIRFNGGSKEEQRLDLDAAQPTERKPKLGFLMELKQKSEAKRLKQEKEMTNML